METSSLRRVRDDVVEADATHVAKRRKTLVTREEESTATSVHVDQGDTGDLIERQDEASEERGDEEELQLAVERCEFERVRDLHDVLSRDPAWQCDGEAMKRAIEVGETDFVTWHLEHCSVNEVSRLMLVAAECGQVEILEHMWSFESGNIREEVVQESALAAVKKGSLKAMRWFHENVKLALPTGSLTVASEYGHLDVVQWLHTNRSGGCTTHAMDNAASNGHLHVVQWLHANRSEGCTTYAMNKAASNGHLDVVQWLHANRSEGCTTYAMNKAAKNGHLDVVQWLHANRSEGCTTDAMTVAAWNGHLAVVQWLHTNRSEGCTTSAVDWAAKNGHLDVVQWLHANRREGYTTLAMDLAAWNGHLDVVQWLHANRRPECTTSAMNSAAKNGHLDVVQWLHTNRNEGCTTYAMNKAAWNGHLAVVQGLHANRNEGCTTDAMNSAAKSGHLAVVQWLHANRSEGCTIDAMNKAAWNGHLAVVQWLHANWSEGCTTYAMDWAAKNGHLDVVQWLHANRSEGCTTYAMNKAAKNGHLDVVQWLHANRSEGCTTHAMDWAAENDHLAVIQWLHANRSEGCTTYAMNKAAKNGHLDAVQWLHTNRSEGCTISAIDWTAENGHLTVLEWLIRNRTEIGRSVMNLADAIYRRQIPIVKALYDRPDLMSWPRPPHANILFNLFLSNHPADISIFRYVANIRRMRYRLDAADNPYDASEGDVESAGGRKLDLILPTTVSKICESHNIPNLCGYIISDFFVGDARRRHGHEDALKRGWVHWLWCFSGQPSRDVVMLAEGGNLAGACVLHDRLKCADRLQCSKRFMYLTMANGDLEYVKWHILKCDGHSLQEWLHIAVWTGRVDVIDWMRANAQSAVSRISDGRSYKMFHSLDVSFVEVAERFKSEVMTAEANRDSYSVNQTNMNVIHGLPVSGSFADITVTGLYGAIVNGHLEILCQVYENRPDLEKWPTLEDGPEVLRQILHPDNKKMLTFFRHERGMLLETRDLNEAAIRGDTTRVKMIHELDLASSTTFAFDIAAVRGDDVMLEILIEGVDNPRYSTRAMDGASEEVDGLLPTPLDVVSMLDGTEDGDWLDACPRESIVPSL
ncbi:hypothetical protein Poli38472_007154 [Pythium oligandrum]|uniref:Ankyrin repeat protein n=1 Tax=Pythium oligandrum TaxID=41045 RepID=A0A8K1FFH9_PYTOL|nr:hypothetical protein Poli38472_007154 [Pythium oligandrum]|eukprot:TMW59009.1 hypothetical protein Poli38472_007154 [Pythium oligandrum]